MTLERLKELAGKSAERRTGESLAEWHDRHLAENGKIREVLPALLEVVEAAKAYRKAQERVLEIEGSGPGFSEMLWQGHLATAQDVEETMKVKLDAALAKLEEGGRADG